MRSFLFAAVTFMACWSCQPLKDSMVEKPNVLFILVDDLGVNDLSCTGSQYYETPNIDSLAKKGFTFSNGYAASSVCSPSRASILTGKFTARHGITDWIGAKSGEQWRALNRHNLLLPAEYNHHLNKEDIMLPEAFQAHGYDTFFAGKWHLGGEGSLPEDNGFNINIGGWDKGSPIGGFFSPWDNPKLENKTDGENLSMRLAKETVNFMKANKEDNFFAFLSFYAVHAPIQTTQDKWKKYQQKATDQGIKETGFKMERALPIRQVQDNPIYAGLVESMDDAVGLVLSSLKELGLDKNTIVVFTSDNGGVASGDNFATSNLPLRGGKGYQWEGGLREPYFIYVPWLEGNKVIDYPVVGTDFYPTILDLANLPLLPDHHVDGVSLKPLLHGGTLSDRPLYWHYPHYGNQGGEPNSIIQDKGWKLIHYWENNRNELYNLEDDPGEAKDVAALHPRITAALFDKLSLFLSETGAKKPQQDPEYNAELAKQRQNMIRTDLWPRLEKKRLNMLSADFTPNEDWWGSQVTVD